MRDSTRLAFHQGAQPFTNEVEDDEGNGENERAVRGCSKSDEARGNPQPHQDGGTRKTEQRLRCRWQSGKKSAQE